MGTLDGKVAIVSGSGRGIGREIALKFAAEGAPVVVNPQLAAAAAQMIPLARPGTPAEAAGAVYLLCLQEANYVSGQCLIVDGARH